MIRTHHLFLLILLLCGASCDESAPSPDAQVVRSETLLTAQRYLDAGQYEQAEAIAIAAARQAPEDARVHELLARIDFGLGLQLRQQGLMAPSKVTLQQALEHWARACTIEPEASGMHTSAGDVASMLGLPKQAAGFYQQAMLHAPAAGRAALCLAQLCMKEEPKRARELLDLVLAANDQVPEGHASVALIEARLGRGVEARAAMERAVALAPRATALRVTQARVERLLGSAHRGVEVLSALGPSVDGNEAVAWELAECWSTLQRPAKAAAVWERCFANNAHRSDAGRLAAKAARAWTAAGEGGHAAAWWRQAGLLGVPQDESSP
jgi:Tfp pilus assembly protein PilF